MQFCPVCGSPVSPGRGESPRSGKKPNWVLWGSAAVAFVALVIAIIALAGGFNGSGNTPTQVVDTGYSSAPQEEAMVRVSADKSIISNELIVTFREDASPDEIRELITRYGGEIVGENYILGEYQIRFTGSGESYIRDLKNQLGQEPLVADVYLNFAYEQETDRYPNDSKYDSWDVDSPGGNNWGLEAIRAPGAWDYITDVKTVRIGLIDSSLQYNHPDLRINPERARVLPTESFHTIEDLESFYDSHVPTHVCFPNPDDCVFCGMKDHGTHCAGIIGALGNNGRGVAGTDWNAEIWFTTWWYLQATDDGQLRESETSFSMTSNITWLVANGCRVISISIGSSESSTPDADEQQESNRFDRFIDKLEKKGYDFLICKSAGNANDDAGNYALNRIMTNGEHARAHVVIVAAAKNSSSLSDRIAAWMLSDTERIYQLAEYSNYGSLIDVAAPGSKIYSTIYGSTYESFSGTSMATPMVAGVAGMLYGANENLTYSSVKSILFFTGRNYAEKNLEVYAMVDAEAALKYVQGVYVRLPERKDPSIGYVSGTVQDARTQEYIRTGAVAITSESLGICYEAEISEGAYEASLPTGVYTMVFSADGYQPETVYHVEVTSGAVTYNALLRMLVESPDTGTASGRIINAFDASGIPNANISVYAGINSMEGTPVAVIRSDSSGYYSVTLLPGNYTLRVSADGYANGSAGILVLDNENRGNQDCSLTPTLHAGEMRIVLTWGRYPEDLDSHLVGPAPDGGRFHVYYSNKEYYQNNTMYDDLDVDDTTSYGPETTSVYVGLDGTYTFYIHNFTDRGSSTSSTMSTSGAKVEVYLAGSDTVLTYNVPNQPGTLWKVFSVNNGIITPINTMSFEEDPAAVGSR